MNFWRNILSPWAVAAADSAAVAQPAWHMSKLINLGLKKTA
jgi:hypothetical protein